MPDKLIDIKFAAQIWYWSNNCEIVGGKKVLKNDAEKLFRKIYSKETIASGKIEYNNLIKVITARQNILDETTMEKNMVDSIKVLNILKQIKASPLTTAEKNSLIRNNILIMPLSRIEVLESMIGKTFDRDSIIDLIVNNVTKISIAPSSKQFEEIEDFLVLAEKIFGDKLPYTKDANIIKKFYKNYVALQTLYANNPDITSKDVTEFLVKNSTVDSFRWSLRALKSLKIDDNKKAISVDDIIKIFEEIKIYNKAEQKCSKSLIQLLILIDNKPELYHLGAELITKFKQKYDLDKIKKDLESLNPSKLIDLKKYTVVKEPPVKHDDDILTSDEENMLKSRFSKDTYNKILYILKNKRLAETNKEEIVISIKKDELADFIKFINSKFNSFFAKYHLDVYSMYEDFMEVIDNKEDLNSYLLENFTINNLSLYLRWLLIASPRIEKKIELNDILLLLKNKKAFVLYGEVLKNELIAIASNPSSYLYGKELISYVKKIYKYDVYNATHRILPFSKFAFVGREEVHATSYAPDDFDIVTQAFDAYESLKPNKFKFEDVLVYAVNYEYYDSEKRKYYILTTEQAKKLILKIAKKLFDKEIDKDIDTLVNNYVSIKTKNIKNLLMHANSFNDVLDILKLRKRLNGNYGNLTGVEIKELDKYFRTNKFYSDNNAYSLIVFYTKIKSDSASYAYSDELIAFYEDYISKKTSKIENLEPRIEKVENKEDSETFEYKIVNRFMPTTTEEKKRALTALVSGIGAISLLTMTAVFAVAPLKAIETCASSFTALLTNPSLASIKDVIGAPLLYFGAIFETYRGFSKHRFKNAIDAITEEDKGLHR